MTNHKNSSLTKQEQFMLAHKAHHHQVSLCRFFIFFSFLFLWEWSARRGWIDAFFLFFPQPGCPLLSGTASGKQAFAPYRSYPLRNPVQLPFRPVFQLNQCHASLVLRKAFGNHGALSGYFKQPAQIRTGASFYCLAGHRNHNHYCRRYVCCPVWFYYQYLYRISAGGCRKADISIQTLGGRKRDAFFKVVLPGSVPTLLSTAKVNIGLALVGVIIGEFLAARRGLGYLIIYGSQVFQLDMVITAILILCLIAFAFYKSIQVMEHRLKSRFL